MLEVLGGNSPRFKRRMIPLVTPFTILVDFLETMFLENPLELLWGLGPWRAIGSRNPPWLLSHVFRNACPR